MTKQVTPSKEAWLNIKNQVERSFQKVFGDNAPIVELNYHDNDYADNDIQIDGSLSIFQVEKEVPTIGKTITVPAWQLAKVWYCPGTRETPPDGSIEEVGESYQRLDDCILQAIKLYAEYIYHLTE